LKYIYVLLLLNILYYRFTRVLTLSLIQRGRTPDLNDDIKIKRRFVVGVTWNVNLPIHVYDQA